MSFRILGPLEVLVDGRPLAIGRNRQRTVLAVLLAHVNRTVSVRRLVWAVWGEDVPRTAVKQVQSCVWRLRALFDAAAGRRDVIETTDWGYRLRATEDEVDTGVFERLARNARALAAGGDHGRAAGLLRAALDLFRGPVLAGVDSPALEGVVARWEERRLVTVEERMAAELASGRHRAVVDELSALVCEHPLREGLRSRLTLALHRCGRRADAWAVGPGGREPSTGGFGQAIGSQEPGGATLPGGAVLPGDVTPGSPGGPPTPCPPAGGCGAGGSAPGVARYPGADHRRCRR
ncbi:AfsR/SARP family transcriptional regulator [Saccharothrix australiensis]|uniref:AfsR/SARP family transcriptional regulator n=1 Tax=Saccharothrix australiensis TaxID=2072 RepID=UPI00147707EB|nr:AfsR/SARP family transcriptional regulator [Saccharothrix australiensis]